MHEFPSFYLSKGNLVPEEKRRLAASLQASGPLRVGLDVPEDDQADHDDAQPDSDQQCDRRQERNGRFSS